MFKGQRPGVYALLDPVTDEPRYVGATEDLDARERAYAEGRAHPAGQPVWKWLQKAGERGDVRFKVLWEGPGALGVEPAWIERVGRDHYLVNLVHNRPGDKHPFLAMLDVFYRDLYMYNYGAARIQLECLQAFWESS